jgi:hypothetical protein
MQQLPRTWLDQGPLLLSLQCRNPVRKQANACVLHVLCRGINQSLMASPETLSRKAWVCSIRKLNSSG